MTLQWVGKHKGKKALTIQKRLISPQKFSTSVKEILFKKKRTNGLPEKMVFNLKCSIIYKMRTKEIL